MNANVKQIERTFTVNLFYETRQIKASAFQFDLTKPEPTRFMANRVVAGRYRTGSKLHHMDIEVETDPVEVDRLVGQFRWNRATGCAYRVTYMRSHGNFRSTMTPLGWADKFEASKFA